MRIITRAEWGAKAVSGMAVASYPMSHVWLHHSATVPTDDPAADMRLLQDIGLSRGFSDVSYTFGLHPDGSILEGRELRYIGAHTFGNNATSLAFVLIGDYDIVEPTPEQVAAAHWLRDDLIQRGFLTPGVYPTGGHRDAPDNSTGCPGNAAWAMLDQFRLPSSNPQPSMEALPMEFTYKAPTGGDGGREDFVVSTTAGFCGRLPFGDTLDGLKNAKLLVDLGDVTAEFHQGVRAFADECGFTGSR